jgi:hypothetical protein
MEQPLCQKGGLWINIPINQLLVNKKRFMSRCRCLRRKSARMRANGEGFRTSSSTAFSTRELLRDVPFLFVS